MASKLNTEFNYRYQVVGETVWAKIKTLQGFLEGRVQAAVLEEVSELKYQAKLSELRHLKNIGALEHIILSLRADIMEVEASQKITKEAYLLNKDEIAILNKLLAEYYELAEPTRIRGYTDEQMHEANAENEFTVWVAREMQAEIIAGGRPSAAKLRNAMSCPATWVALKRIGLIPQEALLLEGSIGPLRIELKEIKELSCTQ